MGLLRRFSLVLLILAAFAITACGDDETGATPVADTDMGVDEAETLRETPEPPPAPCNGCMRDGECRPGETAAACGAGGEACVTCGLGQVCNDDGECIEAPECTPETCSGCCSADGTCLAGDAPEACGTGGAFCQGCAEGSACTGGRCTMSCGPDNCAGCCDASGQCVGGDAADACGRAGGACDDCSILGQVCGGGACVTTSCADTCTGCCVGETCVTSTTDQQCGVSGDACVACGSGQTCSTGVCTNSDASTWQLVILSADIGYVQETFGLPDPYVVAYLQDPSNGAIYDFWTTVWDESTTPAWNEVIVQGVPTDALLNGIYFEIWDADGVGDDLVCDFSVTVDMATFSAPVIETTCPYDPQTVLRWRLQGQ